MDRISLEETQCVALQKRIDSKFLLNRSELNSFFANLEENYFIMEIDNETVQPYKTLYYDTEDLALYREHHNGKQSRFKVRTREYLQNGMVFNELKVKNNRGETIKKRQLRKQFSAKYDNAFQSFTKIVGLPALALKEQLYVYYNRITLVNKDYSERLTIDTDLCYRLESGEINRQFEELVIIELKRERGASRSCANRELHRLHRFPTGFSKYCMGIALTSQGIKQNNFKQKFRAVNRILGGTQWNN